MQHTNIHMSCPDCGWAMFGRAIGRDGAVAATVTCSRCGSITRVEATKLHDGDPKFNGTTNAAGDEPNAYTYDESGDKVALRHVPGQTVAK